MDILSSNSPHDNHEQKRRMGRPPQNGQYAVHPSRYTPAYYAKNKDMISRSCKQHRRKMKTQVLAHYSGSVVPFCTCCGEDNLEFLTIDHINGDGAQHRKTVPNAGRGSLYRWLVQNGYPDGFRTLCYNCNCARGFYGYCPHEKVREKQMILFK